MNIKMHKVLVYKNIDTESVQQIILGAWLLFVHLYLSFAVISFVIDLGSFCMLSLSDTASSLLKWSYNKRRSIGLPCRETLV